MTLTLTRGLDLVRERGAADRWLA
ncbi:MAG: hypothetical protein QOK35_2125, partial [Pseudonocardiales bacterium]|nr:hypothetical protein [Pseudonocardiales bacterium]